MIACMYIYVPCACKYSQIPEEGVRDPETGVTDGMSLHVSANN